jgi:hypothetical protein
MIILLKLWSFIKNIDWKSFVKGPFFIVTVACAAFFLGKCSAPKDVKVVTVDKVTEIRHEVRTIQQQLDIDQLIKKVQESARTTNRTVVREIITQRDGGRVERETENSNTNQTNHSTTDTSTKVQEISEIKKFLDSYKQEEKIKVVEKLTPPDMYRIGVQVGYGKDVIAIPSAPQGLMLGVYGERQIIGKLNAGIWLNTARSAGLQLSYSF